MGIMDYFIEKITNIIPGKYFGILSVTFGVLGDSISYLLFPYTEYNLFQQPVSALCLGNGGIFFNIMNIFSGIFALIFVNSFGRNFDEEQVTRSLKRNGLICANISCICFIILGFFCGSNIIIAYIHGIAALTSWGFGFLYFTYFNILMLQDSKYSRTIALFGFIVPFLLALLMIIFFLHLFPIFRFFIVILPFLEWINTFAVIFWYYFIPFYMIYKKI
jgi:hypothetical protein